MKLTESEEKLLLRLEKNIGRTYISYIAVAMSLSAALVCLIIGIKRGDEGLFFVAMIVGGMGINLFFITHTYQKLFSIISKLKQSIKDLEKIVAKTNLH